MKNHKDKKLFKYLSSIGLITVLALYLIIGKGICLIPDNGGLFTEHKTISSIENPQGEITYEKKIVWCEDIPVQNCQSGCWERWPPNGNDWLVCDEPQSEN